MPSLRATTGRARAFAGAVLVATALVSRPALSQAVVKVSDNVNFRLGILLQPQLFYF